MVTKSLNNSSIFHNPHLKNTSPSTCQIEADITHLSDEMKASVNAIQDLGVQIEVCGSWVWVFGAKGSHEAQFRAANFKWSYQKVAWYLCPPNRKPRRYRQVWEMAKIRETYGSRALAV